MTSYDPDGNPKRRARKGEDDCDGCKSYRDFFWKKREGYCGRAGLARYLECKDGCCADDYAGDCKHFTRRAQ